MATRQNPIELINQIKEKVIVAILGDDEIGEHLVLKGGNLLQFAYQLTTRSARMRTSPSMATLKIPQRLVSQCASVLNEPSRRLI